MPYRTVGRKTTYAGKRISMTVLHLEDEHGGQIQKEIVQHPGAVVILPMPTEQSVLLIRNYRYTVGGKLIEIPAGTLEKGEEPIHCAARELIEETGHRAGRLVPLASFYASPGVLTEKMHVFAAYDLEQAETDPDAGEEIELLPVSFDDALNLIRDGQIQDGKTIATLLMYDRFYRSAAR